MALFDSVLNLVNKKSKVAKDATPFDIEARQASLSELHRRTREASEVYLALSNRLNALDKHRTTHRGLHI